VPAYGPQNDVTLKMPAFEWVHVQLHQQKGMISLSPPTICNSALWGTPQVAMGNTSTKYGKHHGLLWEIPLVHPQFIYLLITYSFFL
ncbi:hypothetical protein, partial [Enterobacter hormaechei]|uniref:hypothetical protein n=1 Tax=Enterobacter hormaechei TaxID=158836 RepID=UPI003365019B